MTPLVQNFTTILSFGIILTQVFIVLILAGVLRKFAARYVLEIGFAISFASILTSLFYSNIAGFEPCEFCWWQRILLFPQAILFAVALYYKNKNKKIDSTSEKVVTTTSLVMSVIGAALAFFQYYGQMFNPTLLSACVAHGASCTKLYFVSFGYITIPLMSFTGFALLITIAFVHKKSLFQST
jgi:disulfide bond formation protein DsbB